jgi:hypothetical protein
MSLSDFEISFLSGTFLGGKSGRAATGKNGLLLAICFGVVWFKIPSLSLSYLWLL